MPEVRARRGLYAIAAVVVILAGIEAASAIVVPVLLALFLAFVSSPLVFRLSRARVPYGLAVALVLFVQVAILSGLGVLLVRTATDVQQRLPLLRERTGAAQEAAARWLSEHAGLHLREALELVDTGRFVDRLGAAALQLGALLGSGVLVVLVLAFTLFDASRLWRLLDAHFDHGEDEHIISRVSVEVNRYLTIKTSSSAVTGLLLGLWCWLLGVELALFWGLVAFLLNYVPNIGSIVAAVPPVLLAWLIDGPTAALLVAAGYLTVNMVIGNILEPRWMGKALGMSPLVVVLSIVLWGFLLGPIGALLSAPLTMIVKIALSNTRTFAWVAELMSHPRREDQRPVPRREPIPREA